MKVSNCCGAVVLGSDCDPICKECREHCEAIEEDEDEDCPHDWKETDSQFSNEKYTEVKCVLCGMVGEKEIATGKVFFPAT